MLKHRIQIRFSKEGDLRMISHRDLMRVFERLFRRAKLELAFSEGFHPKPKIQFASALSLGIEGKDELMEVGIVEDTPQEALFERLSSGASPGLNIHSVVRLPADAPKLKAGVAYYEVQVPPHRRESTAARLQEILGAQQWETPRDRGKPPVDVLANLVSLELDGETLRFSQRILQEACGQARDILRALNLSEIESEGSHIVRTTINAAT